MKKEKNIFVARGIRLFLICIWSAFLAILVEVNWLLVYNGFIAFFSETGISSEEWAWLVIVVDCFLSILVLLGGCSVPALIVKFKKLWREIKKDDEKIEEMKKLEEGDC